MRLIVAEKDSVARGIAKILSGNKLRRKYLYNIPIYRFNVDGDEHVAIGLRGHLLDFDFPSHLQGWDLKTAYTLFDANAILVIREEAVRYVAALRKLARSATVVYLALDADSEGEAIAYEAALIVKLVNPRARLLRIRFNAVTRGEILRAFRHPMGIDVRTVEKVFTRMILDLTIGAAFTRALTSSVRRYVELRNGKFLSYGPCQTPVLALVVSREDERRSFKPSKYYVIRALAEINGARIELRHPNTFNKRVDAEALASKAIRGPAYVKQVIAKHLRITPPEPLDTVELERRLSKWFHVKSKVALSIAEELYRRGYISYPRTETTIYPPSLDLREILRSLLSTPHSAYVKQLLAQPKLVPTKGNSDDGAHPPIHPVRGVSKHEIYAEFGKLGRLAWTVYDFVVRHFLATLSPPAVVEEQRIIVDAGGVEFVAEGRKVLDEGYWTIYPFEKISHKPLPTVSRGEHVKIIKVWVEERETEPPPPMTEHELLALMKRYGIGTDATMQDHIHTNVERGYMTIRKSVCVPTQLGVKLVHALRDVAPMLVDHRLRAEMEKMLQMIALGRVEPTQVLNRAREVFRNAFATVFERWRELGKVLADAMKPKNETRGTSRNRRGTGT